MLHRGSEPQRRSNSAVQEQNPDHFGSGQIKKALIELREEMQYPKRYYLHYQERHPPGSQQYMGTDETGCAM